MDFFFDRNHQLSQYANDYFVTMTRFRTDFAKRLGQSTSVDSKRATPVQAADLLAYEVFVYMRKKLEFGTGARLNRRPVFELAIRRIKSIRRDMKLFDKHSIDGVLKVFWNQKLSPK